MTTSKYPISQVATSRVYPSRSACPPPPWSLWRLKRPNLNFGKLLLRKLSIWEDATWEIVTLEVTLVIMSYEKNLYTCWRKFKVLRLLRQNKNNSHLNWLMFLILVLDLLSDLSSLILIFNMFLLCDESR